MSAANVLIYCGGDEGQRQLLKLGQLQDKLDGVAQVGSLQHAQHMARSQQGRWNICCPLCELCAKMGMNGMHALKSWCICRT